MSALIGGEPSQESLDLGKLRLALRDFVQARDWEKFHTPKNLVMALAGEVGELTELFQWLTADESASVMAKPSLATKVRDELADVVVYCLRLADVLHIDLAAAISAKLKKNAAKYPVLLSRGHARKYTELRGRNSPNRPSARRSKPSGKSPKPRR